MITETWLCLGHSAPLIEATTPDFTHFHQPRLSGRGGGLAVVHKHQIKCSLIFNGTFLTFELLSFLV